MAIELQTRYMIAAFSGKASQVPAYLEQIKDPRQDTQVLTYPTVRRCPKCGAALERTQDYVGGRGYVDGWACGNRLNIDHWCGYGVLDDGLQH